MACTKDRDERMQGMFKKLKLMYYSQKRMESEKKS